VLPVITRRKQQKSFCYDHCDVNPCAPLQGDSLLKIGKAFSTSLHLWFCIRIPITIVVGLPNLFQNIGDLTTVFVVQINNMIALITIVRFKKIRPDSTGVM